MSWQFSLEQHLHSCEACRREWNAVLALHEDLALTPLEEPSPNLLAATRMRLDEALDAMPARSVTQRLRGNAFRWMGLLQGAPALATLLIGVGFLERDSGAALPGGARGTAADAGDPVEPQQRRDRQRERDRADAELGHRAGAGTTGWCRRRCRDRWTTRRSGSC